jgi:hypothetical protein
LGQEIQFIREGTEIKLHANMNQEERLFFSRSQKPLIHFLKEWKKKVLSKDKMVIFCEMTILCLCSQKPIFPYFQLLGHKGPERTIFFSQFHLPPVTKTLWSQQGLP